MAGKKLLVADDSLTIQKVIRLALSNEGYEIQAVSDGNDALQQISLIRPDLVLIDISLPGKSAFEVKRAINEMGEFQNLKFVLMSSAFEKVDDQQIEEVQFHGRLTKPFDPANLRQVLQQVLGTSGRPSREARVIPPKPPVTEESSEPRVLPTPPPKIPDLKAMEDLPPLPPMPTMEPVQQDLAELESLDMESSGGFEIEKARDRTSTTASLNLDSLWEEAPQAPVEMPMSPPPLPPSPEEDIRQLTESTIRMSGLADDQWSIDEKAKRPPPFSQKKAPPAPQSEISQTLEFEEPMLKPGSAMLDSGNTKFTLDMPPPPTPTPPPAPSTTAVPISSAEMEEMIRKEVKSTLEGMARRLLPEIAEKVIKQEIHRLLGELH